MQLNTSYKEELLKNLEDQEYRKAFVESHINNGIAFQIRTMRNSRKLKQEDLGKLAGMKQEAICRLENPNYGNFTLNTLKEIASAFNVALMVKFIPFGDLVKWDLNLSSKSLDVPSFDQEKYFKENNDNAATIADNDKYKGLSIQEASNNVVDMKDFRVNILQQQSATLSQAICW